MMKTNLPVRQAVSPRSSVVSAESARREAAGVLAGAPVRCFGVMTAQELNEAKAIAARWRAAGLITLRAPDPALAKAERQQRYLRQKELNRARGLRTDGKPFLTRLIALGN